ncbi:MAG: MerR family transcriptional regulator [Candidatus Hydrogenedentes bacterium]|nr:MerR family transcriptional regulator [Candidatus Hydrogenedentota bacterium]
MTRQEEHEFKLAELAERSGVPARTIRLYIAKGLVPPPLRAGRDAAYGQDHLDALHRIREGQRAGLTLNRMRHELAAEPARSSSNLPEPECWWDYPIARDVRVNIRGDASGMRLKKIREVLSLLHEHLGSDDSDIIEEPMP